MEKKLRTVKYVLFNNNSQKCKKRGMSKLFDSYVNSLIIFVTNFIHIAILWVYLKIIEGKYMLFCVMLSSPSF